MLITPLYAGLLGLWYLLLGMHVVRYRNRGISLGDGGDEVLMRRIRGHGNFSEYVPLVLVLMVLLELSRFPFIVLHVLGVTLLIARLLHGYALSFTPKFMFGRFVGALLTFLVLLIASALCVYQGIRAFGVQ